jgi:uncharacterized OB-fold protein
MTMAETSPASPATLETQPYWDAARDGLLLIKSCRSCGQNHSYPRALCPFCFSSETGWVQASGKGKIYSFSVMRRVKEPYVLAYVTLDEGPTMMTNIVDCRPDDVRIDQPVRVVFKPMQDGTIVPMFTPAV